MTREELEKAAYDHATLRYLNADGDWCEGGLNPMKQKSFLAGAEFVQAHESGCSYCGGQEFYTINPLWIPGHWKAANKHGLCVKCTNIYRQELEQARIDGARLGFEAARSHIRSGCGFGMHEEFNTADDFIAILKAKSDIAEIREQFKGGLKELEDK